MYDIEEDFDFGYVPTVMAGSRSGSMKKMTKKQPKTVPKQPLLANKSKPKEQFDDLLDGLSLQQSKKVAKPAEKKSALPVSKNSFDDIEPYFDQPKSISLDKTKQVTAKETAPTASFLKTSIFKNNASDEIMKEDIGFNGKLGKTELTLQNSSKEEDVPFVSNRNMKPPLKKKDNPSASVAWSMGNMALTIPEEERSIVSSKKQEDDEIIRPPPRLMSKRSIESKIDKKDDQPLFLLNASKQSTPLHKDLQLESKKEKKEDLFQGYNRTASLALDEPKDDRKNVSKLVSEPERKISKAAQKWQTKIQPSKGAAGLNLNIEQSYTMPKDSPSIQINQSQPVSGEWQKEFEQMRSNFQRQVDFLQENLDKQIAINRETREKVMQDASRMIEDQRQRSGRMHQEQVKRMKDLFEWQKTRMEQTYKAEIDSLRHSLDLANKTSGFGYKTQQKEDTSHLQMQLRSQKRGVEDREKILEQREREFEQRQIEMNRHRKQEQQRLRGEQKRLMEQESKWKKQMMTDKRMLTDEKQRAAIQIATLELELIKKRENAEINLKQNSINHESIENERNELRLMNAELTRKHRGQIEELESQKQRVRNIEQQLIKRLRVLEAKNREVSVLSNTDKRSRPKKENNWLADDKFNTRISVQKQNEQDRSMANIARTKDRFHQLEGSNRLNVSVPEHGKFNLQNYMMTMQQYNKLKSDL